MGAADWFWRAGRVARFVLLPLRAEFVLGFVACVRAAGLVASRVRLLLFVRAASRLLFERVALVSRLLVERTLRLSVLRVAVPRVAVVLRLLVAGVVVVRSLVARLAERTDAASATRAGRADVRLLRSTSGL